MLIISKDGQTATGDWANFDVKANTVLMGDHVVVSRGKDVAEGPRLKIDLTTGMYRFELEPSRGSRARSRQQGLAAAHGSRTSAQPTRSQRPRVSARQAVPAVLSQGRARTRPRSAIKKLLPDAPAANKAVDGWQPSTSASPVQRSD